MVVVADRSAAVPLLVELDGGAVPEGICRDRGAVGAIRWRGRGPRGAWLSAPRRARFRFFEVVVRLDALSGGWRMRESAAGAVRGARPVAARRADQPSRYGGAVRVERYLRRYRHSFILVTMTAAFVTLCTSTDAFQDGGSGVYVGSRIFGPDGVGVLQAALADNARGSNSAAICRNSSTASLQGVEEGAPGAEPAKALAKLETGGDDRRGRRRSSCACPSPPHLRPPLITPRRAPASAISRSSPVLSGLDLRLDPDDRVALLGANGNGKTTFARLLAGRMPPMAGPRGPVIVAGDRLFRAAPRGGAAAGRKNGLRPPRRAAA